MTYSFRSGSHAGRNVTDEKKSEIAQASHMSARDTNMKEVGFCILLMFLYTINSKKNKLKPSLLLFRARNFGLKKKEKWKIKVRMLRGNKLSWQKINWNTVHEHSLEESLSVQQEEKTGEEREMAAPSAAWLEVPFNDSAGIRD